MDAAATELNKPLAIMTAHTEHESHADGLDELAREERISTLPLDVLVNPAGYAALAKETHRQANNEV